MEVAGATQASPGESPPFQVVKGEAGTDPAK